jgi:hypothetical protein
MSAVPRNIRQLSKNEPKKKETPIQHPRFEPGASVDTAIESNVQQRSQVGSIPDSA